MNPTIPGMPEWAAEAAAWVIVAEVARAAGALDAVVAAQAAVRADAGEQDVPRATAAYECMFIALIEEMERV